MAETSRQTQGAHSTGDACATDAGAHIERWAVGRPRTARDVDRMVWGGDRGDPRLFYFRALLASGWFFGGVTRV